MLPGNSAACRRQARVFRFRKSKSPRALPRKERCQIPASQGALDFASECSTSSPGSSFENSELAARQQLARFLAPAGNGLGQGKSVSIARVTATSKTASRSSSIVPSTFERVCGGKPYFRPTTKKKKKKRPLHEYSGDERYGILRVFLFLSTALSSVMFSRKFSSRSAGWLPMPSNVAINSRRLGRRAWATSGGFQPLQFGEVAGLSSENYPPTFAALNCLPAFPTGLARTRQISANASMQLRAHIF